jgi:protein involved in polysaccharide export with SLBB domain
MIAVASFIVGCASQAPQSAGQAPGESARLSPGDIILVTIMTKQGTRQGELPAYLKLKPQKIQGDGTIALGRLRVVGLTPKEAGAKIRLALIKNLYGFATQILEVKVVKVYTTLPPKALLPDR